MTLRILALALALIPLASIGCASRGPSSAEPVGVSNASNGSSGSRGSSGSSATTAPTSAAAASSSPPADAPVEEESLGYHSQFTGPHYKVRATLLGPCRAGDDCRIRVRLEAVDGYRVSVPYPQRFEVRSSSNIELLGTDPAGKTMFSKAAGDFVIDPAHPEMGTMTVRFHATTKGNASMTGLFYLAVETDKETTIARPMMDLVIPVK